MRLVIAAAGLVLALRVDAAGLFDPQFLDPQFLDPQFLQSEGEGAPPMDVEVPNVVGQADFATADAILEGEGLDGLELDPVCSDEPEFEIVSQSPAAGTLVAIGTVVSLRPSSGMACPPGPESSGKNVNSISIDIGIRL